MTTRATDRAAGGDRVDFLGLMFDRMSLADVADWLRARAATAPFAYVVTPNVDHMVRLETMPDRLRHAYADADLCLCDSRILHRLARLCGVALTVAPGSDLVPLALATVLAPGERVCLVGGSPEIAAALAGRYPALAIVHHQPPMGLLHDEAARRTCVAAAVAAKARLVLLAVGSPQQELIAREMRDAPGARGTAFCIGAAVEFVVGRRTRAPRPIQRAGLEWAWRLLSEPRRLARRYLIDGPAIFPIALRWSRGRRGS